MFLLGFTSSDKNDISISHNSNLLQYFDAVFLGTLADMALYLIDRFVAKEQVR